MKYTNRIYTNTLNIPYVNSFSELAESMSISNRFLYSLINQKDYFYRTKIIPKKSGAKRELHIPSYSMKAVQRWIYLNILVANNPSQNSMAFRPSINGILETAKQHKNNTYILEMDLHDFFNNINKERVYKFFLSIGYNYEVSYLLSELCTYNNCLPQGAVTSPCLSNLICYRFDMRLSGLCNKRGVTYTRYADDLSFSSNDKVQLNKIQNSIVQIIKNEGFSVNNSKTRFLSNFRRKNVLGLNLNDNSIHVPHDYKRIIRSEIFNCIRTGNYSDKRHIIGEIMYVNSIENKEGNDYIKYIKKYLINLSSKEWLRSNRFLSNEYNKNKFFEDLPDCISLFSSDEYL